MVNQKRWDLCSRHLLLLFPLMLTLLVMVPFSASATATATLNQYISNFGESVNLTVSVDSSVDKDPDFSVLKQDFDILNQSQSSNMSIVNGSFSRKTQWDIVLMPKKVGLVQVPSIQIDDQRTKALVLNVLDGKKTDTNQRDIWLEMVLSEPQVMVQAQDILTIKLYRKVNISQPQLNAPNIDFGQVEKLGDEKSYESVLNQQRVIITEVKYAIFPNKAGTFTVPPVQFDAVVGGGRSMFVQGRAVRILSDSASMTVLAKPEVWDKSKTWMPASDLSLTEAWKDGQSSTYRVGEPFTRTVQLKASGVTAAQIPPLLAEISVDNFKSYPDQPVLNQSIGDSGLVGERIEKIAMIPTAAGQMTLPEIKVSWWNTQKNRVQTAMIASRQIDVLPASNAAPPASVKANNQNNPVEAAKPALEEKPKQTAKEKAKEMQGWFWKWFALIFALSWFVTMFLWYRVSSKAINPHAHSKHGDMDKAVQTEALKAIDKQLKAACKAGDAKLVLQLLPKWGAAFYRDDKLMYLAQMHGKSEVLDKVLLELEQKVYAGNISDEVWSGEALLAALANLEKMQVGDKVKDLGLKPLYK